MKRPYRHIAGNSGVITFRRWANKSYSAFQSLGCQIRIGHLKIAISAVLSTKAAALKKKLSDLIEPAVCGLSQGDEDRPVEPADMFREISFSTITAVAAGVSARSEEAGQCPGVRALFLKYFLLRLLFAAIAIICITGPGQWDLYAQSDTTIMLEEVAIMGNRLVIPFAEASRNIEVINRLQIKLTPAQSIPEVLSYVPGVDIRQRGPAGIQADISIRGGTFEQTLVLVNGIKLTDPQTGHHSMSLPFNIESVERIEVLKGPGARAYGQNAYAGAVNFITGIPADRRLTVRGYGGSFGSFGGALTLGLPGKKYSQLISAGGDASDGYRHNTDYRTGNVFYQSELDIRNGKLAFIGGWTGKKFGANGFYASPDYEEQYEEVQTGLAGISFEQESGAFRYKARVYWRGNSDRYLFVRNDPEVYKNFHKTNVLGVEWNGSFESAAGVTGIGMEYRKATIRGAWVRSGVESKSNLDGFYRSQAGLFAEHKFRIGRAVDVKPGLYLGWYTDFGWQVFPGIDLGYSINENWRIYANAGRSYRIPTFYEQYYQSPVERGNEDLQPEKAWTYEAGVRFGRNGLFAEANVFYRKADGLIDWIYSDTDSIWEAENIRESQTLGTELSLTIDFKTLTGRDLFPEKLTFSYNYTDNRLSETESLQSRYALDNIRNQLIAGLDHRIFRKLKNSVKFRFIDRIDQGPYLLIDDRLYWEQSDAFMIFLEATNLTGQSYTEVMTPMPGRWIRAGIRWETGL